MSLDRFIDEEGHLVVDGEFVDYVAQQSDGSDLTKCNEVLDNVKCERRVHRDSQHWGFRGDGTTIRWES